MTEFTSEFIEKQREQIKFISPLPWTSCSCGKCGSISNETDAIAKATMGNWGDDYPDIRRIGGSIEGKFETFMNQITYGNIPKETGNINAQYIADACNNYPDALDEIERLQARVEYLEDWQQKSTEWAGRAIEDIEKLGKAEQRITELEQERRWIPVSERLPEESGYYLIAWQTTWGEGELFTIQRYYKKEDDFGFGRVNVKYWQPLPQPPKEEE